jgi:hypothetical protein
MNFIEDFLQAEPKLINFMGINGSLRSIQVPYFKDEKYWDPGKLRDLPKAIQLVTGQYWNLHLLTSQPLKYSELQRKCIFLVLC